MMNTIDVLDYDIVFNGIHFTFPLSYEEVKERLGEARIVEEESCFYYIYDDLGIVFEGSKGTLLWLKKAKGYKDAEHNITSISLCIGGKTRLDIPKPAQDYIGNVTFMGRQVDHRFLNRFMGCYQDSLKDDQGNFEFAHVGTYIGGDDKDPNYDGNIFLKPLTFSFSPRRPESNENYDVVPSDEECLVFDNFNFKLAVLNELIYEQELIKPYFDIYDYMKFKKAHWNLESERNIRAAVQFFKDLQVPVRYADKIEKLIMDGGNDIYMNICPMWDGEDNRFDVDKLTEKELKQFSKLKEMTVMSSTLDKIRKICEPLGIKVEEL